MVNITRRQIEIIFAHARRELPCECCGLIGGAGKIVNSIYEMRNAAENPSVEYEAAAQDLFAAQKLMRRRGENLIGIYHSHPRQSEPVPSRIDVERAFYADAIYFIVGFDGDEPILRAFAIREKQRTWQPANFVVIE